MTYIDKFFIGKVLKQIEISNKRILLFGKTKTSILLSIRGSKLKLNLKNSASFLLARSVSYSDIGFENIEKITQGFAEIYALNKKHDFNNLSRNQIIQIFEKPVKESH